MNLPDQTRSNGQSRHQIPVPLLNWARSLQNPNALRLLENDAIGLANGLAGLAILPLTLSFSFPEQPWLAQAQHYFSHIAQKTQDFPLSHPGLYHGSCGVLFVLSLLAQHDERYQNASQLLWQQFLSHITSWNWQFDPFLRGQENFEVIGGAAGIIRVLLTHTHENLALSTLERLCSYLLWVSEKQERWIHQPERLNGRAKERYPTGYFDLGMAHGLAGPLAALSLVMLQGYGQRGMSEAITRWASWLLEQRLDMPWGYDWPSVLPVGHSPQECQPARSAWCYGTPGIARALWLAGRAIDDASLCRIASEALASALRRQHHIEAPQLCHGKAGLLLICLRFAQDSTVEQQIWLHEAIALLTEQLQEVWQGTCADLETSFLTGATGAALTLLAVLTQQKAWWDLVFLLS